MKKQSVCYTHFHSNKVFRGDLKENNPDIINPSITRTREEPEESCVPAADMIDGMDFEQLKEEKRSCTKVSKT